MGNITVARKIVSVQQKINRVGKAKLFIKRLQKKPSAYHQWKIQSPEIHYGILNFLLVIDILLIILCFLREL